MQLKSKGQSLSEPSNKSFYPAQGLDMLEIYYFTLRVAQLRLMGNKKHPEMLMRLPNAPLYLEEVYRNGREATQ